MAPGNNGASTTPEGDDPFGYLYADGQAAGATPPDGGGGGYGYPNSRTPRTSYNQVRPVGERQYGQQVPQQQQTAAYGQQTAAYGQPNAHYQAPETMPGAPSQPGPPQAASHGRGSGGRGSGGPNTKALLIGAVAVVAAVVIGIGVAMLGKDTDDKGGDAGGRPSNGPAQSVEPSQEPSKQPAKPGPLPKTDAKKLTLAGGTSISAEVPGAKAAGGQYVAGFSQPGAALTWTVSGIPKDGQYKLHVDYGVPGKDSDATIDVNGTKQTRPLNMTNFAHAKEGDWAKGWTNTWAIVQLTKGTNAITISCAEGNQCNANFDRLWLTRG
ncbi:carbohydrate-binding protein [Streptomyces sp. NPDC050145]|uniref:carbohydrate-binding protein n=1 Tax=Streptomyces sp. NPDC050145 TaxID=3365602 RepID=UPI003795D39C